MTGYFLSHYKVNPNYSLSCNITGAGFLSFSAIAYIISICKDPSKTNTGLPAKKDTESPSKTATESLEKVQVSNKDLEKIGQTADGYFLNMEF